MQKMNFLPVLATLSLIVFTSEGQVRELYKPEQ